MKKIAIAFLLLGALLINTSRAEIELIPKEGKLQVKAKGEVVVLKDAESNKIECALKLEDGEIYILVGRFSKRLQRLEGEMVEIEGLLRARVEINQELIPSIEVSSFKKIEKQEQKKD